MGRRSVESKAALLFIGFVFRVIFRLQMIEESYMGCFWRDLFYEPPNTLFLSSVSQ